MLLNTLQHTARPLRPPTAEHHSARRMVRKPLCSKFKPLRSFLCHLAEKSVIPTTRPLFPTLLAVSFNPVTNFSFFQIFAPFLFTDYKINICSLQTIANCKKHREPGKRTREPGKRTSFHSPCTQRGRRCAGIWPLPTCLCLHQLSCPSPAPTPIGAMNPPCITKVCRKHLTAAGESVCRRHIPFGCLQ